MADKLTSTLTTAKPLKHIWTHFNEPVILSKHGSRFLFNIVLEELLCKKNNCAVELTDVDKFDWIDVCSTSASRSGTIRAGIYLYLVSALAIVKNFQKRLKLKCIDLLSQNRRERKEKMLRMHFLPNLMPKFVLST